MLTPLLQALDALGVNPIPAGLLIEVADALDEQAEACRPHGDAFTNPAKALAVEFAGAMPLDRRRRRAGRGGRPRDLRRAAAVRRRLVGVGVSLPDGVGRAGALLRGAGGSGAEDFFRDRVDEPDVAAAAAAGRR